MKYKHRPIEIEAIQFNGENKDEILKFTDGKTLTESRHLGGRACIIGKYDWIVKENEKFYLCTPEMFEKMFEVI
jgi:hypothetical protein